MPSPLNRRSLSVLLGLLIALTLFVPGSAAAKPRSAPVKTPPLAARATDTLPEDLSTKLPRTRPDEAVGDFRGLGYDQRAVVESGSLQIYNPPSKGGTVLNAVRTDLVNPEDVPGHRVWEAGAMADLAAANGLGKIRVAASSTHLYLAGLRPNTPNSGYGAYVYQVARDGSCASASCASWVRRIGTYWANQSPFREREGAVTSLAIGRSGDTEWLAVGTSDARGSFDSGGGVYLYDTSRLDPFSESVYQAFSPSDASQVAVTDLAWDPRGSGRLAIALAGKSRVLESVLITSDNRPARTFWDVLSGSDYAPAALSAAITNRADGTPVAAFGMSDGSVKLFDPAVSSATLLSNAAGTDPVTGVAFAPRIDGTTGLADIVASSTVKDTARVLRYSGGTTLAPQPVTAGGGTSTDVGTIRQWFPGYKTGKLAFGSIVGQPLRISFASRPNAGYGCWYAPQLPDRKAFPAADLVLPGDGSSETYSFGGLTSGIGGGCAATDFTGQWAAYVVVSPVDRPQDTTTAKLVVPRSGTPTLTTVGGSVRLRLVNRDETGYALGSWLLVVEPRPNLFPNATTIKGTQLDPVGTERPVYRFDVPATKVLLGAVTPPRIAATMQPLLVEGLRAGIWSPLGKLIPQGPPARATSGTVTLAPVSFYWQNPEEGPPVTVLRLRLGDGVAGAAVLADLPVAPPGSDFSQLVACPTGAGSDCTGEADPYANGLDEARIKIQFFDGATVIPTSDPLYQRIYYRDDNGDLLTGLIPMDNNQPYIRVSPYAGAYPNDGSSGTPVRPPVNAPVGGRYGYVSTTRGPQDLQAINATVGGSSNISTFNVVGQEFDSSYSRAAQAATGFELTGCADYRNSTTCRVATPTMTAPALYITADPTTGDPLIGMQFATVAQTATATLPLQQLAGQPEHTVNAQKLDINNGELSLTTTAGFQPADAIDTWVVSHGQSIQIRGVQVGGGN